MIALKNTLFSDLENPMEYLQHQNFKNSPFHCETIRAFKDFAFLRDQNGGDSFCITTPCRVLSTSIHQHNNTTHNQITIELDPEWIENLTPALEQACLCVFHTPEALPQTKTASADAFWNTCQMPFQNNTLTIKEASFTKRGHKKQFINMYNKQGKEESLQIYTGGSVIVSLGFYMYESVFEDRTSHGFRPKFVGGIRVLQTGGPPPIFKSPWSWHDVVFPSMSVDMHDSFQVRMPPMTVLSIREDKIELNIDEKPQFKAALQALYTLSNVPWPTEFYVQKPRFKSVIQGSLVLVYAKPSKNNNLIEWEAQKIHRAAVPKLPSKATKMDVLEQKGVLSREVAAVAAGQNKRPSDTLDSWLGVQTKKKCK